MSDADVVIYMRGFLSEMTDFLREFVHLTGTLFFRGGNEMVDFIVFTLEYWIYTSLAGFKNKCKIRQKL